MGPRPAIAAPSILSADLSKLAAELAIVDPAGDWVHCDIMDNHFVPNLTFGPMVVAAARKLTTARLDVHLMVEKPETLVERFRGAGADLVTVHLEACEDPSAVLAAVRATGAECGLAIKPGTPFAAAEPFLESLGLLLVMTVEPGFGGQSFREEMLRKVEAAAAWRDRRGGSFLIEVDGGIAPATARLARAAGADVFVAGHAVFRAPDPRAALAELREAIRGAAGA